ncbi:MAG: hypothetical protein VXZ35_12655, partial [Pseudomonadota bacterium]|nr:hypothetical protein [Pseudomonadota bacterium]
MSNDQYPSQDSTLEAMRRGLNTSLSTSQVEGLTAACSTTGHIAQLENRGFVAIFGSPIWKCASLQALADTEGNAAALTRAYKTYSTECLDKIGNDFSIAIVDVENGIFLLAVDHLARHPIYYYSDGKILVFGTNAE